MWCCQKELEREKCLSWPSYQNTYSRLLWEGSCSLTGWDLHPPVSKGLLRWSSGNGLPPLWSCAKKLLSISSSAIQAWLHDTQDATWQNLSQKRTFQILILLRIPTLSSSALFHAGMLSNFYWPVFSLWITCKSLWN